MKHDGLLVSVIMPTYNRCSVLPRAIHSVLNQTYQNIECIVVDDGSTDKTNQAVSEISDTRLRYIHYAENNGVSRARNEGLKAARGRHIAFLDSDDEYLPERIEENLKALSSCDKNTGIICSNFWNFEEDSKVRNIGYKVEVDALWHVPSPSTWLVDKGVFDQIGFFDEEFTTEEDRDFLLRFSSKFRLKYIDKPLVVRYKLKGRLSSQTDKYIAMRKIFLKKHMACLRKNKKYLSYQFYRLGKDLFESGHEKEAREYFLQAFLAYPIRIEYLFKFFQSGFLPLRNKL